MTDFDEFLRKRNEERAAEARNTDVLFADQGKEWQRLKDELRRITDGKRLGTDPFEWSPYPAPYTDFLKLKDVAVVFATTPIGALAPGPYRIVFARRPLRANEVWVDDEPISAVNWVLTSNLSAVSCIGMQKSQVSDCRHRISRPRLPSTSSNTSKPISRPLSPNIRVCVSRKQPWRSALEFLYD